MARFLFSLRLWALAVALLGCGLDAGAQADPDGGSLPTLDVSGNPRKGPGDVYARVPATDEFGRDQLAMFRA